MFKSNSGILRCLDVFKADMGIGVSSLQPRNRHCGRHMIDINFHEREAIRVIEADPSVALLTWLIFGNAAWRSRPEGLTHVNYSARTFVRLPPRTNWR